MPASMAVCTTAITSPASGPNIVKPRMRSLRASSSTFIEAARLPRRPRPKHGAHWQRCDAHRHAAAPCFDLAEPDPRQGRVREQTEGDEPVTRRPAAPGQIVADHAKVVLGHVRELGAAGALADRP